MKKITRRRFIRRAFLTLVSCLFFDILWFEKYFIDWKYYDISSKNDRKIKIIQISDLHLNEIKSFHTSIAKKINQLKPDLIFITGDVIDKNENLNILDDFLKLIDSDILKYAITGNWEYWGEINLESLSKIYSKYNCELLINENKAFYKYDRSLSIIGIDDFVGGNADFEGSVKNLSSSKTNIVLSHCPEYSEVITKIKNDIDVDIDLVLSGHTHGGQITFFGLFAPFKPKGSGKYLKGWYNEGIKMYVSKGIGTSLFPIRFGARSEVTIIDI